MFLYGLMAAEQRRPCVSYDVSIPVGSNTGLASISEPLTYCRIKENAPPLPLGSDDDI